jgi:hypothetical protein
MTRCVTLAATALAWSLSLPLAAQVQRPFPPTALRGDIVFGTPPAVTLNGQPARLAPGARVRGEDNMLILSGALVGRKATVHYTRDGYGQPLEVWILRPQELARKPWPTTPEEAGAWTFDAAAQAWRKP